MGMELRDWMVAHGAGRVHVRVYVAECTKTLHQHLLPFFNRYVEVSLKIFNELIKGCRKHLPLFVASVLKLVRLLLEKNEHPELKIIATETVYATAPGNNPVVDLKFSS